MTESASYESLVVSDQDGIAEVVLTGPGKGNAMGPAFFRELPDAFASLDRDRGVRAVIVRGRGGIFTYGLDLMTAAGELMPWLSGQSLASERSRGSSGTVTRASSRSRAGTSTRSARSASGS